MSAKYICPNEATCEVPCPHARPHQHLGSLCGGADTCPPCIEDESEALNRMRIIPHPSPPMTMAEGNAAAAYTAVNAARKATAAAKKAAAEAEAAYAAAHEAWEKAYEAARTAWEKAAKGVKP